MADFMETEDKRSVIKEKLRQQFDGKIVRKDLTKKIKEGANVPVYVLEFLLGQYCSCLLYTSSCVDLVVVDIDHLFAGEDAPQLCDFQRLYAIKLHASRVTIVLM